MAATLDSSAGGQGAHYDNILFENAENINQDQDFWFQLRGHNNNPFIDAATPLLGVTLRIRNLTVCDNVSSVYQQIVEEIRGIEVELNEAGVDRAELLAYRYVLCSFIDEAVMSTPWGADGIWAECSLLTKFHNETWGGEKVFSILARLESDAEKYKALLNFIFLCLTLGFEGRYKVMNNGKEAFEKVVLNLHQTLERLNGNEPDSLTNAKQNVVPTELKLPKQWSAWSVLSGFSAVLVVIFACYFVVLHDTSVDVLNQLNQLIK
ncbi:type IVB secretion system protein IcmH/DotU [Vibrio sp. S4M6]|uniref:type IVB secretion system protein IcmH/DotU n=1 Tax=Vibrio sinus TaxID=2946865 RepID=UPI00202A143E|nr:type IVB secretion system protein IcmH/DotU [Vibrio sinus]MCL9781348.1 type IVB secretion system protein IcmH/DotU [Vibrio sinus]